MRYGQVVIGPPGSGKTTYCLGMRDYLRFQDKRVVIVNLDPANGQFWAEEPDVIDIEELVSADRVARELALGPNGSMIFALEYVESHIDWLVNKINSAMAGHDAYLLLDLPGQVELVTHHSSVGNIVHQLGKACHLRLCAVHLVDSSSCTDAGKFIGAVMLSMLTMLRLALPHVNVLSKIDLLDPEDLDFPLDFYTELSNVAMLVDALKTSSASGKRFAEKHKRLNQALCELIEEHPLVAFFTLNVKDPESMQKIHKHVGVALGYLMPR